MSLFYQKSIVIEKLRGKKIKKNIEKMNVIKRNEKKQTIDDIAKNLLLLANDDEHITKQLLPELEHLLEQFSPQYQQQSQSLAGEDEVAKEFAQYLKDNSLFYQLQESENHSSNSDLQSLSKRNSKQISNHAEKIVWEIQKRKSESVKKVDLLNIAKYLSGKYQKTIPKRDKKAKGRILEWISNNWDIFEPSLHEAIDYALNKDKESTNKASTTENDENMSAKGEVKVR